MRTQVPFTGWTDQMLFPPVMTWRVSATPFCPGITCACQYSSTRCLRGMSLLTGKLAILDVGVVAFPENDLGPREATLFSVSAQRQSVRHDTYLVLVCGIYGNAYRPGRSCSVQYVKRGSRTSMTLTWGIDGRNLQRHMEIEMSGERVRRLGQKLSPEHGATIPG